MNINYKKYIAEDFAQDIDFINWVKRGENEIFWKKFIEQHPELSKEINSAIEIINYLSFKSIPSEAPDLEILSNLENNYSNKLPVKKIHLKSIIRYAAIFALLMSLSVTLYYLILNDTIDDIQYSDLNFTISNTENVQLILADGKKIDLSDESKQITINSKTSSITVDNKNTIDNTSNDKLTEVSTPYGAKLNVILPDGTNVWLNSNSKLIFPQQFSTKSRKVFLNGEAYFKVPKDIKRPFIVNANQITVTVLGTEFNVNNRVSNNQLEVVLVEGIVNINSNQQHSKSIQLVPAQKISFDKTKNTSSIESNVNIELFTSWKDGYLVFMKQNINEVFDIISHYYNVKFVTGSKIDINRNISGKLELKDSLNDVMEVLSDIAFINYTITGNIVEVTSIRTK